MSRLRQRIVVIGASAGAVTALSAILATGLPFARDSGRTHSVT
jgi:chemotaxis response regulator CheB